MAEDRDLFRAMMDKLQIPMPESGMAVTVEDALEIANKIGYPVMVRPSYVLGGRGMEVVHDDEAMTFYMRAAVGVTPDRPIRLTVSCIMQPSVKQMRSVMARTYLFRQLWSTSSWQVSIPETPLVSFRPEI